MIGFRSWLAAGLQAQRIWHHGAAASKQA